LIAEHRRLFDRSLLEKIVLVGFVCVLFVQSSPESTGRAFRSSSAPRSSS